MPSIIIHPGFAKCATTSIQSAFQADDYKLCKKYGVVWLGRGFQAFNGEPPVFDIAQDPKRMADELCRMSFECRGTFFVSAENIVNHPTFYSSLCQRFRVLRTVFTIRHPFFLLLSEYCFRGWINESIEDAVVSRVGRWPQFAQRKLDAFAHISNAPIFLCALEYGDLLGLFTSKAFGLASGKSESQLARTDNRGINPCLAVALHKQLMAGQISLRNLADRRELISRAKRMQISERYQLYLPNVLVDLVGDKVMINSLSNSYFDILRRHSCGEEEIALIRDDLERRLELMRSKGPLEGRMLAELTEQVSQCFLES